MKKYLIISSITNLLLSFVSLYGFIYYLALSATKSYSFFFDMIVLLAAVIVDLLINYVLYKILKLDKNKIFIFIPTCIFMLSTSILFLFIKV